MIEPINDHLRGKREQHLEELKRFISMPSISTQSQYRDDIMRCACYASELLRQAGLEHVELLETGGYPIVYGDWLHARDLPTVLVYGHYDVQPPGPLDLWETPPFEPEIRDEKLYARGASDNKSQIFLHIKSIESLLALRSELPINIKFCIEGEEEIGSPNLTPYLLEHKERFRSDLVVISDTAMLGENQPAVCYGLRGLIGCQIDVRGPRFDLPSGAIYGGAVQNPIHALVELLAGMRDHEGRILIEGFYDDVLPISEHERAELAKLPFADNEMMQRLEVLELFGEQGYTTLERAWARPTLEVNGIYGGYQGEGGMTIIPSTAHAKITCRLVPNQDPQAIFNQIESHVHKHLPPGVTVTVSSDEGAWPYLTPIDHPAIQLAAEAYESAFGVPCHYIRAGGSIPVVETLSLLFHVPIVLMGFGLPTGNVHGPNEFFSLRCFDQGVRTLCYYWLHLTDRMKVAI